jgi:hypothetical protein
METADDKYINPLFGELDQFLEDHNQVTIEDFYTHNIKNAEKTDIFPTQSIDSVFAVLCTDENYDHKKITKKSFERAKKVFKFSPKHVGVTDRLLSDIFSGGSMAIDVNFFGFISEDVAKKILSPNQWLVRCDDESFIVTKALPLKSPDADVVCENHRVLYDDTTQEYVWYFKEEVIRCPDWETIVTKMRTNSVDATGAPLLRCCEDSILYNWRDGEEDIIGFWVSLVSGGYNQYLFCLRWFCAVITIEDPVKFFNAALAECFNTLYYPYAIIDAINVCLAYGADLNNSAYCPMFKFACCTGRDGSEPIADHVWRLGGDPNAKKDGVPVFFLTASKKDRAHLFMRNPKLDINIEDKDGHNVAWHCGREIDLAVFNDKKLNFHQVVDGKTLMDHGIADFKVPYILKLISAGIDVKRPSATKLGTYLHAFLSLAKKGKDDEIISVIRAMVEAGIDVQELNSFYQTPLHIAVAFSTPAVVRALIVDNKANPNGHQESDMTPLHIAAERGDTNVVKTLLELGADQLIRNARGQLPRDVALYAVKALFGKEDALPAYKFKAIKVAVTNPTHPQFSTNVAVIDDYLYTNEGFFPFLDWWDDYGFASIECFSNRLNKFERLPLSDIFDKSKPRTWEEIPATKERICEEHTSSNTFLKVNETLWFNGKDNHYVIYHPDTQEWTKGPPKKGWQVHHHYKYAYYNYYENKIMFPRSDEITFIDKTTGLSDTLTIDKGDYFIKDNRNSNDYHLGVLQDNVYWFVAFSNRKTLFALNIELRRVFKVLEFDFELTSALVCFGNRFLISTVIVNAADLKIFILDLLTMHYSLHEIEFDVVPETDFDIRRDTITKRGKPQGTEDKYKTVLEKGAPLLAQKKLPIKEAALTIYQSTLLIFGGRIDDILAFNYLFAIDLSQLVPYLSLEQHCALTILKNKDKIDNEKMKLVSDDLKIKIGLY